MVVVLVKTVWGENGAHYTDECLPYKAWISARCLSLLLVAAKPFASPGGEERWRRVVGRVCRAGASHYQASRWSPQVLAGVDIKDNAQ